MVPVRHRFDHHSTETTKITGICIQIIKDIVDWLETTSGFSVAVVTPSVGELLDEQISSVAII